MPSNFLQADINFPKLDGSDGKSADERFAELSSYLYLLLEQLRYAMNNLDAGNFNEAGLAHIGKTITDPIYMKLEDTESGLSHALDVTADGLMSRISDAEGGMSELGQTVDGLSSRITTMDGTISELSQTAEGLSSRITDAEGRVTTLQQNAGGLTTRVSTLEGNVTTLTQTSSGLETRVSTAEGNVSSLQQTASGLVTRVSNTESGLSEVVQTVNGLSLSVTNGTDSSTIRLTANGTTISSKTIQFTGMVSYSDLSTAGSTTINGGNITTGTINAIDISGSNIYGSTFISKLNTNGTTGGEIKMYYSDWSNQSYVAGGIRLDDTGAGTSDQSRYRMYIYTKTPVNMGSFTPIPFALKLASESNISVEAVESVYVKGNNDVRIQGANVYLTGNVYVNGRLIS